MINSHSLCKWDIVLLQKEINESLDNAIFNGYELDEWSSADIASDIGQYDLQFQNIEQDVLIPLIEVWKQSRI